MLIVHVFVHVQPEHVDAFRIASLENARASLEEAGVLRFDVLQDLGDPSRFVLCEVYRNEAGAAAHKETAHYRAWRDGVAEMMAEPRRSTRYAAAFPAEQARWATPAA